MSAIRLAAMPPVGLPTSVLSITGHEDDEMGGVVPTADGADVTGDFERIPDGMDVVGFSSAAVWGAAEVAVAESVAVAFEGDDFGVVDDPVDHGGSLLRGLRARPLGAPSPQDFTRDDTSGRGRAVQQAVPHRRR